MYLPFSFSSPVWVHYVFHVGDPWRDATVSSDFHTRQGTPTQPIAEGDGFHCSDLLTEEGTADPTVLAVQQLALRTFKGWLAEWKSPAAKRQMKRDEQDGSFVKPVNAWLRNIPSVSVSRK